MELREAFLTYELESIVGPEYVLTDPAEMTAQSVDVWWITRFWLEGEADFPKPFAIVFPKTKEQVSQLVRFCNQHGVPCIPRGGGAGDSGGALPITGGIVIDLKRMNRVLALNERSLTVRVQPGIIQKDLEEYLNCRGYTMNHLPASISTSALGGFISTNGTGVLSSKYGKMTDLVHQLEVVLPDGSIFKSLPVKLHSTGPDYSRLFIGAEGTLGVVVEAVCKIYPLPEKRSFRTYLLSNLSQGIEAGRLIMINGLSPSLLRLYDEKDTQNILKKQYGLETEGCVLLIGFDGLRKLVDVHEEVALEILTAAGGNDLGEKTALTWWENRYRSYYPPNDYIYYPWMTAVLDTVAPYEHIEAIYLAMKSAVEDGFKDWGAEFHAHFSHWYDWGTSFYPSFVIQQYPQDRREAIRLYNQVIDKAVSISLSKGGVVNEHHGIGLRFGRLMTEAYGESYELARSIKKALDPNKIMNPGKLGLGG
jgi:alkyldihydroxyacetonephosphate synthase